MFHPDVRLFLDLFIVWIDNLTYMHVNCDLFLLLCCLKDICNMIKKFIILTCVLTLDFEYQGPAQAQNLRDSLAEAKSDIVVKVTLDFIVLFIILYFYCYIGRHLCGGIVFFKTFFL